VRSRTLALLCPFAVTENIYAEVQDFPFFQNLFKGIDVFKVRPAFYALNKFKQDFQDTERFLALLEIVPSRLLRELSGGCILLARKVYAASDLVSRCLGTFKIISVGKIKAERQMETNCMNMTSNSEVCIVC
jgi:hypothetical protein